MYCKNKKLLVGGLRYDGNKEFQMDEVNFECIVTNDSMGRTLSISDENVQFTIPFEPLAKYLEK